MGFMTDGMSYGMAGDSLMRAGRRQAAIRGTVAHNAGAAAEDIVARDYARRGSAVSHRRLRNGGGEIDMIAREGDSVIFIEVKKSRTFNEAATRLGRRQMDRICAAASVFLADEPRGQLTETRFDLALVDGQGRVRIVENAFGTA